MAFLDAIRIEKHCSYRTKCRKRIKVDPLYPFSYGLSYTNFEMTNLHLEKEEISIDETVKVFVEDIIKMAFDT